tara:strand:- start:1114 stop:1281 length:168 start_codon:yes stop_codon:yes gene_type:complete
MKFHIYWQTQFGGWQKYSTKHNQDDAFRVMSRRAASTGKRHKMTDDDGRLLDLVD